MKKIIALLAVAFLLNACSLDTLYDNKMVEAPHVTDQTRAGSILASLPAPPQKLAVVVYDFSDQTGQFKNNGQFTDYSSAVTKGGYSILVNALLATGNKSWFTVVERGGLKNLLQERQIINQTRQQYTTKDGQKLNPLPPMLYGGILIEGGIISYDSNVLTGGAGASYFGLSGNTQYHRDLVTVYLRAVNIQTGEVLSSVTSSKTVFSLLVDANFLRYLTFDKLLQTEAGFTVNEPTQIAVRQAIETALYSLVMEGAISNLWTFNDPAAGKVAINEYLERRDGKAPTVAAKPQSVNGYKPDTLDVKEFLDNSTRK